MKVSRLQRALLGVLTGCGALAASAGISHAQPSPFINLGTSIAPTAPQTATRVVTSGIWNYGDGSGPGEILNVKWLKIAFPQGIAGDNYFDFTTYVTSEEELFGMAMYDNAGQLIATDEFNGYQQSLTGFSFGSTAERVPFNNPDTRGQDGELAPGEYWIAIFEGPIGVNATVGGTNWEVSSVLNQPIGFGEGNRYIQCSGSVGNTIPVPAPINDDCANAIVLTESVGSTPAWTGSNFGATQDGTSPCYRTVQSSLIRAKDLWFTYVPTQTGYVQIGASTSGNQTQEAVIALFGNGCGTPSTRCVGGGAFDFGTGGRIAFAVTQGVPVLFSVSQRAGYWGGTISVNINRVPAPCNLGTPAGAISEAELCGELVNEGCSATPIAFAEIAPGQTVAGKLFNTTTTRDRDYYAFTLTQPAIVDLRFRAQFPANCVLIGEEFGPGTCFGDQAISLSSRDLLNPCAVRSGSAPLPAGTYKVALAHLYADGFACDSGYNDYWVTLGTRPCDQPVVIAEPSDVTGCVGASVTFTAEFASPEAIGYQWQAGVVDSVTGNLDWIDLSDGEFGTAASLAIVSGTDTAELTISDLDVEAFNTVGFRCVATTCTFLRSRAATLTPSPDCPSVCDTIDFNNDSLFPDDNDLVDLLSVLAGGECSTGVCNDIDFNNDGLFPDDTDLVTFLRVLAGGGC